MAETTYKRGTRKPKSDVTPAPAAETPKVPWTWEEDGMTVILILPRFS